MDFIRGLFAALWLLLTICLAVKFSFDFGKKMGRDSVSVKLENCHKLITEK